MNERVTLTLYDIVNIIRTANNAGMRGEYVYSLSIMKPQTATQGENSCIVPECGALRSASESEPTPIVYILR